MRVLVQPYLPHTTLLSDYCQPIELLRVHILWCHVVLHQRPYCFIILV